MWLVTKDGFLSMIKGSSEKRLSYLISDLGGKALSLSPLSMRAVYLLVDALYPQVDPVPLCYKFAEFLSVMDIQFSSVTQSCPTLWTPWIAARQASLSITNSRSSLRLMSIESVMPSSHLILCRPLLLLPPVPPSIRVFSNESTLHMRWPKYWSFSLSIIPSKEIPGLISLQSKRLSRVFSNTTLQKHQFFGAQPSY